MTETASESVSLRSVRTRAEGDVGRVILDRPHAANSLDLKVITEVAEAAELLVADGARVLIIESAITTFSAGMDLHAAPEVLSLAPDVQARWLAAFINGFERLDRLGVPTIAKIDGACAGAGVTLAAVCDLRVATQRSTFWLPEIALGVPMATEGFARVARLVGLTRAAELVLTGRRMRGAEALESGFLTAVVADKAELEHQATEWCTALGQIPPILAGVTTRQLRDLADSAMSRPNSGVDLLVLASLDRASKAASRSFVESRVGHAASSDVD